MTPSELAAAPRLTATETRLVQAAVALAAETRGAQGAAHEAAQTSAQAARSMLSTTPTSAMMVNDRPQSNAGAEINQGSGKAPVSIPSGATPEDLMRVASALRQQLLRSSEPTLRDRELAGLASKIEARARAMARSESQQRMELLKDGLDRPGVAPRVIRPEMEHIIRYLDELNQSRPDALSYYAEEKMRDLVLDVQAEPTDIRMLDPVNLALINGVVLGERADNSFAALVMKIQDPYPGETVFVDEGA
jgi:hypothetical protein